MHRDAEHDKVMAIVSVHSSFCLSGSIIVAQDRDKIHTTTIIPVSCILPDH